MIRIKHRVKIKGFGYVIMLSEDTKILEMNQYQDSDKTSSIIYADLESLIKTEGFKNNHEKSSTAKLSEHVPSRFPGSTISSFKGIGNKHDVYRVKDCKKSFVNV